MTAPLPADPDGPAHLPAEHPALRILPAPDTEPPFDADPWQPRPRLRSVNELPLPWGRRPAGSPQPAPVQPPSGPPGARRAAWRLVNAYLDVLSGRRPLDQLLRTATPVGADCLRRELVGSPKPGRRISLQSVHVAEPMPGSAEVVVVLTDPATAWAVAVQLQHRAGQWRCAHFETV